jgi:hypothetical protein
MIQAPLAKKGPDLRSVTVLAGSESEKKFGFEFRYCYKLKIIPKNQRLTA